MDTAGVLPSFTGIAVHDTWAPYDCYPAATHALCNAHLLRELVAVTETVGLDERGWCRAEQVRTTVLELKALVQQALTKQARTLDPTLLALHTGHIRSAALIAANTACRPGDPVAARHRALARRILGRQADYLRFATDFRVPFDNNRRTRDTHGSVAGEGFRLPANLSPARKTSLRSAPIWPSQPNTAWGSFMS